MKYFVPVIALVGLSEAATIHSRQRPSINDTPSIKAMRVENLPPTMTGQDIKHVKMTYGPFKLRAGNSSKREGNSVSLDPQGTAWRYLASDFPTDITVVAGRLSIQLPDGQEISNSNGVYNHHAFFLDTSKELRTNIQCQKSKTSIPAMNSILGSAADAGGAGNIKLNVTSKPTTGNFIDKGHKVLITGDLVNYNNETKEVYMVADLQYVEGKALGLMETTSHLLSVGTCDNPSAGLMLQPPKDKKQFSIKSSGVEIREDSKVLAVRGHMHDGGVNMVFQLNGKQICDSRAEYNAGSIGSGSDGGMLSGMSTCLSSIDVKRGDIISMEANYDFDQHPAREHIGGGMADAMALMVVVFGKDLK